MLRTEVSAADAVDERVGTARHVDEVLSDNVQQAEPIHLRRSRRIHSCPRGGHPNPLQPPSTRGLPATVSASLDKVYLDEQNVS